jgi:hypothetical protein
MSDYSYSKEISQANFTAGEFDRDRIRKMFTKIFEAYNPKVRSEIFDSFCEDFYDLVKELQASNERIWRMIITDMLFSYDERGYLDSQSTDNKIKRKQFAIIANVIIAKLRKNS